MDLRAPSLRTVLLLGILLPTPALAQGARSGATADRSGLSPNVLVVLMDDVGVDQVGVYAESYPGLVPPCTPTLDAFATTAVRFTNAWTNPVCSPTRAQILTGRRAEVSGIGHITHYQLPMRYGLQPGIPTIPMDLPGYATAALGKWHLTDPVLGPTHPRDVAGFDEYFGSLWNLDGPGCQGYADWLKTELMPGSSIQHQDYTYATTDTTSDALLLATTLPEPWFLYVAYHSAHSPYHCPVAQGFLPAGCSSVCLPAWCQACAASGPLSLQYGLIAATSRAMVEALDEEIGRLLDGINPKRTAVFVLGDNGSEAQATLPPFHSRRAKGTLYQAGVNVPLLARVPGTVPGLNHQLVSTTDLFATIVDLSGAGLPADPARDSVSFLPYLEQPGAAPQRSFVYAEFFAPNFKPEPQGGPPPGFTATFHRRAIRDERYKLIEARDPSRIELGLFHLASEPPQDPAFGPDPFEDRDLMLERPTWTPEIQAAYDSLTQELAAHYPALPVPPKAPLAAVGARLDDDGTTLTTACGSAPLAVRHALGGSTSSTERSFFDFDVSGLGSGAKVFAATLDVTVLTPASSAATAVDVCRLAGRTTIYACGELYHLLDGALVYASQTDWTLAGKRTIALSADAVANLQAALSSGVFSLGLKLSDEATLDGLELDPASPAHLTVTFAR